MLNSQRINITITEQQLADLREMAQLEQTSVSAVVRDCIRAVLPSLVAVTRFTRDPLRTNAELLEFADQMESALATVEKSGVALVEDAAKAVADGVAAPPADPLAPSSNTGPNSGTGGVS